MAKDDTVLVAFNFKRPLRLAPTTKYQLRMRLAHLFIRLPGSFHERILRSGKKSFSLDINTTGLYDTIDRKWTWGLRYIWVVTLTEPWFANVFFLFVCFLGDFFVLFKVLAPFHNNRTLDFKGKLLSSIYCHSANNIFFSTFPVPQIVAVTFQIVCGGRGPRRSSGRLLVER